MEEHMIFLQIHETSSWNINNDANESISRMILLERT